MISAKEANKKVNDLLFSDIEKEWEFIEEEINKAIQAKKFSIYISQLSEENLKRLSNLGYNYQVVNHGAGDKRWKISWDVLN